MLREWLHKILHRKIAISQRAWKHRSLWKANIPVFDTLSPRFTSFRICMHGVEVKKITGAWPAWLWLVSAYGCAGQCTRGLDVICDRPTCRTVCPRFCIVHSSGKV